MFEIGMGDVDDLPRNLGHFLSSNEKKNVGDG